MTRTAALLFTSLMSVPLWGNPIQFTATTTLGSPSGPDWLAWANLPLSASLQVDSAAPPTSCSGPYCVTYTPSAISLLINNSLYTATSLSLLVLVPPAFSSMYQLSGTINVAPFVVGFGMNVWLPEGVLTPAALIAPPVFSPSTFDFQFSNFSYGIIGEPQSSTTFSFVSGVAAATAPEPATFALLGGGLIALAGIARLRRR